MKSLTRCLLSICINFSVCAFIYAQSVTVLIPEVKAPYDAIFDKIFQGISEEYQGDIVKIKLPRTFNPKEISSSIQTDRVIALGKRGMHVAKEIYLDKPVVVGALPIKPNGISGVSLMAAPNVLFDSLHNLAPKVKTITVLYTDMSAWIIDVAKQQALIKGLALNPIKVDDLKSAVQAYNKLFEQKDLETMAIWLPLDPITANDKVIVPIILEKAWKNKMVVFSSKPTHTRRGALFSAMPNNESLGKQLAKMVTTVNYKVRPSTVTPMNGIKLAVNLRTAAHLGYKYNSNEQSQFAITFP